MSIKDRTTKTLKAASVKMGYVANQDGEVKAGSVLFVGDKVAYVAPSGVRYPATLKDGYQMGNETIVYIEYLPEAGLVIPAAWVSISDVWAAA